MTLLAYNKEKLNEWEGIFLDAARLMRQIRQSMTEEGMEETMLEATKASMYIEYLKTWAIAAEAKHRQNVATAKAKSTRAEVVRDRLRKRPRD